MRLTKSESEALYFAINGIDGRIFLFGSRAFDDKKGGDIDILVFSEKSSYQISMQIAVKFFSKCESKIDVIVLDPGKLSLLQKAFIDEQILIPIN
jgi:uncharacterized protein